MRLFPHSLIGKAKEWYLDQSPQVTNWNTLEKKFQERFYMEAKTTVAMFSQGSNETLCEACDETLNQFMQMSMAKSKEHRRIHQDS